MIRRALDLWYAARDLAAAESLGRCPVPGCRHVLRAGQVREALDTDTGRRVLICTGHRLSEAS